MSAAISPAPSPRKLARRLGRRLRSLLKQQSRLLKSCRREGAPEQIHELRAVTRRLRVLIELAAPLLGRKRAGAVVRDTRRLSRATGRLRDCDVSLALLARHTGQSHAISVLQRRRRRLWLRHRRELALEPTIGPRRFERLLKDPAKLARRYARKLERHRVTLLALITDLAALPPHQQHAFRRTVRRLRYLRELGLPRRHSLEDPVCASLTRTQAAVGGLLDAAVCRSALSAMHPAPEFPRAGATARLSRKLREALKKLGTILLHWKPGRAPASRP